MLFDVIIKYYTIHPGLSNSFSTFFVTLTTQQKKDQQICHFVWLRLLAELKRRKNRKAIFIADFSLSFLLLKG